MGRSNSPKVDLQQISAPPKDEFESFLEQVYFWLLTCHRLSEEGDLNKSWVAFEALGALFPVLDEGGSHDKVKDAYPFPAWREETVEVPLAVVRQLVLSWNKYKDSPVMSLGQAFEFEHINGQGRSAMRKKAAKINEGIKYANEVFGLYAETGDGSALSLEDAFSSVAERYGKSVSTIRDAFYRHRQAIEDNLQGQRARRQILTETSRSSCVDNSS